MLKPSQVFGLYSKLVQDIKGSQGSQPGKKKGKFTTINLPGGEIEVDRARCCHGISSIVAVFISIAIFINLKSKCAPVAHIYFRHLSKYSMKHFECMSPNAKRLSDMVAKQICQVNKYRRISCLHRMHCSSLLKLDVWRCYTSVNVYIVKSKQWIWRLFKVEGEAEGERENIFLETIGLSLATSITSVSPQMFQMFLSHISID